MSDTNDTNPSRVAARLNTILEPLPTIAEHAEGRRQRFAQLEIAALQVEQLAVQSAHLQALADKLDAIPEIARALSKINARLGELLEALEAVGAAPAPAPAPAPTNPGV